MRNLLKFILLAVVALGLSPSAHSQTSFYTDRAVGTFPLAGRGGITGLIPIQYGQVRLCTFSPTPPIPCPAANGFVFDLSGNPLTVQGSNFGQITTDVVGRFSFGCMIGQSYTIQVAASSSNVPILNYPVTCPGTALGSSPIFNALTINNAGVFTNAQMNEFAQFLLNSCSPATEFHRGFGNTNNASDALTGCIAVPVGATSINSDAVAAYANNSSTGSNTVGLFSNVTCLVTNSHCWGANPLVQDVAAITGATLIGTEIDVNVLNTSTVGEALLLNGVLTAQPTSNNFPAMVIAKPGANQWTTGIIIQTGATEAAQGGAIEIFPAAAGATQFSQSIGMCGSNAASALKCAVLLADANGNLLIQPAGTTFNLNANGTATFPSGLTLTSSAFLVINGDTQGGFDFNGSHTGFNFGTLGALVFRNGGAQTGAADVSLSRASAGVLGVGSGAQGSTAGTIQPAALLSGGAAAGLTGTGACATFGSQSGGSLAGQATCTAATAASTITITPGTTAPHGWVCIVQDQTTRANLLQQTSNNATTCTLTATSVTQNDVFVFTTTAF